MNKKNDLFDKISGLLITNKFGIIFELFIVFLPLYFGLIINSRIGINQIPLWDDVVILGGPFVYLGLFLSIFLLWLVSRLRGAKWESYGLQRPKSWLRTILMSLGVALAVFGVVVMVINPILNFIPNLEPRDMSRFDILTGNLPSLLINIVLMWITAGFLEEFIWRGYLMNRLIDLLGSDTKLVWLAVVIISTVIFGLGHGYQGTMGMLKTGAVGLVFGLSYFTVGKSLWPLVFAHALIDSLDFITHYFGG